MKAVQIGILACLIVVAGRALEESYQFGLLGVMTHPRLVGHGCQGAGGPLYAYEEDEFPPCDRIEASQ